MGRRRRSWTAVVLLLFTDAGCAANTDRVMDVTYDPCSVRVLPEGDAMESELQSLDAASELWNRSGGFRVQQGERGGMHEQPLIVHFRESLGPFHGYYDDEAGEISIPRGLSATARTVTLAHEIGHAFGLWHVERAARRSVMNPGNTTVTPTERDVDDVRALWGKCDERRE